MRYLNAAALAVTGALLALSAPVLACDYSMKSDVTADAPPSAPPARTAEASQPAAPAVAAATTPEGAAPSGAPAPSQTAEADIAVPGSSRPN
ncbi:MAG: hypothetical protein AB7L90_20455 [Hyphomicrobiaceae bacterium]